MDNEDLSADDGSFETVTDGDEQSLEQDPEELINQTTEKQSDTNTLDNLDERVASENGSEETISEHSIGVREAKKDEEETDPQRVILEEQIQKALQDRKELQKINQSLQSKLAVFFKTKKIDMSPYDKPSPELEKVYQMNLNDIAKLENQLENFESDFNKEVNAYEKILKDKEQVVHELSEEFAHLKRSVALRAVDSQSGKRMSPEEVDYYLKQEEKRDKMLREIRLEYVKHHNALKEAEKHMEKLDSLSNSVDVIEFDQLGVQIQTYFMKIGQREERRDEVFVLKGKQETARVEGHELKQKFKLLQNDALLDDYFLSKQKYDSLVEELENLKKRHSSIMACFSNKNKDSPLKR